jgi:glycosyltransferase involved in cell wall biosynthesis
VRICSPQIRLSVDSRLGGGVYDYQLLRFLGELGSTIEIPHLLESDESDESGEEAPPGFTLHPIPLRRLFGLGAGITNAAFYLRTQALTRERSFDLLRIATPWYSGPAVLAVGRASGIPTVAVFHHLEEKEDRRHRFVHRLVARRATGIHVGSKFAAKQLSERYGIPLERIEVIPYGVDGSGGPDPRVRDRVRREHGWEDRPVLLHVGSLIARKNLLFLVDVFESIFEDRGKPLLLLCGEGYPGDRYKTELLERIERSPARTAIQVLGAVSEPEKSDLYRAADILVHPSRVEGFGFSVVEAMAHGMAVVASRAGSLPEVVEDGRTGLLASPDDAGEFAQKLGRVIRDPELRRRLGGEALVEVTRRFTWERCAKETLRYYRQLAGIDGP